jgi:hypothetical protein
MYLVLHTCHVMLSLPILLCLIRSPCLYLGRPQTTHIVSVHLPTASWSFLLGPNVFFRTLFSAEVRNACKMVVRKPVLGSKDRRSDGVGYIRRLEVGWIHFVPQAGSFTRGSKS